MANGFQLFLLQRGIFAAVSAVSSFLPSAFAFADDKDDAPARRVGVIFEGTFESAEVTTPLSGARKTQLVAFYEWSYGVRQFKESDWKARGLEWEGFLLTARAVADGIVDKIEPELVKDFRGVTQYAIVVDKDPFLTSILLSPRFLERFRETLGDRIQVVLVDRHRLYLFPATGGLLADFGPALVEEFRRTPLPVSLEIFLVDDKGYRVIGELERPDGGN